MADPLLKSLLDGAKVRRKAQRLTGLPVEHPDRPSLEQEILGEMVYALRCAERKLVRAIEAVEAALGDLRESPEDQRRSHLEAAVSRHQAALDARWELVVHREAIGLTHHDDIDALYPIPPRPREN